MKPLNQIKVDEIPEAIVVLQETVGLTKAHYELTSAKLKVVFAELYNAISDKKTEKAKECEVYSNLEYQAQLHRISDAMTAYHKALGELEAYQQKFQLLYLREKNHNQTY